MEDFIDLLDFKIESGVMNNSDKNDQMENSLNGKWDYFFIIAQLNFTYSDNLTKFWTNLPIFWYYSK